MQSSTLLKMWIHYCTPWLSSQTADQLGPTTTDCQQWFVETLFRSPDLINLGLAVPNCLADKTTGHSCDPYVLLRDGRLYLLLYCEHVGETRTE